MDKEKDLKIIREQEAKGRVSMMNIEGLVSYYLAEFVKQPAEGILYDLNRDKVTTLTASPDIRWINDYAVAVVITFLKSDAYQKEIAKRMFTKWLHDEGFGIDELDELLVIDVKPLYFKWLDQVSDG